jgi:hypothetical protein
MMKLSLLLATSILLSVALSSCGRKSPNEKNKTDGSTGAKIGLKLECDKLNLQGKWNNKTYSTDAKTVASETVVEYKMSNANTYTRAVDGKPVETASLNRDTCVIENVPADSSQKNWSIKITALTIDAKDANNVTLTTEYCTKADCSALGAKTEWSKVAEKK